MQRVLSTVVLLGLLLACAAAFAITEHLKLIKSQIYDTHVAKEFSPVCRCATDKATINFKLRRADSLTVTIVNSLGNVVDTLATHVSEPAASVTFHWDGHTSTGARAPDGKYRAQVELANARSTIRMPNTIVVDTTAPTIVSASDGDGLLTSGEHPVVISYLLGQKAHAVVYLGDRRVVLSRATRPRGEVKWFGKNQGKVLPPGRYVLDVGAVDTAGNETPSAERKLIVVRIRAIAVDPASLHVAPGARFTVSVRTAAPRYRWTFAGARGSGTKTVLHLRAPSRRGRYRLVVSEHGHSATALVTVGQR